MLVVVAFCCVFIRYEVSCIIPDYHWREYTGVIPSNAVVAGQDQNRNNVYIGQAYIRNNGLIVAQIRPGSKEVSVPMGGIRKIDKNIKILCGPQLNFKWLRSNAEDLHLDLLGKHPVIGGQDDSRGLLYVGRVTFQGEMVIGKVNAGSIGDSGIVYNNNGAEKELKSYEVLYYINDGSTVCVPHNQTKTNWGTRRKLKSMRFQNL